MDIRAHHMNTVKFTVPSKNLQDVIRQLKDSGVKYYPIRKLDDSYRIEVDNHPIASLLLLKFG